MAENDDFVCVWNPVYPQEVALIRMALQQLELRFYLTNELASAGTVSIGAQAIEVRVERGRAAEARAALECLFKKPAGS